MQKPQGAAAMSPQAPPATRYTRADPAMDRETQAPRAHHPPAGARPSPGTQAPASSHPCTARQSHQPPVQVTSPKGTTYSWTQEMVPFSLGWRRADSPTIHRRGKVAHEPREEPSATKITLVQPPASTPSRDRSGRVHPAPTPSRDRPGRVHPAPTPSRDRPGRVHPAPKRLPPTSTQTPNKHPRTQTPQRWTPLQEGPRSEEPARIHPTSTSPAHHPHLRHPAASHPPSHNKPQQQGNSPIRNCNQAGTTEPRNPAEYPTQYKDRTDSAAKHPRQEGACASAS
ncbi:lysine-rich arabinogalactan protein 19-like [Kryptolebias marmoratus]|uniref:lysine-rich arabinogalactan protein 19-like n=1 Tax=Kryptolebias marmoratus TaxID=37003 RepID=UPI0007F92A68|nr:lysine-rich arabinogalactan protein 19-like [Kryptolebias marmoratus]